MVINVSHKTNDDDKYLFFDQVRLLMDGGARVQEHPGNGLKAINLHDGDESTDVAVIKDSQPMIIGTPRLCLSNSDVVRSMAGVRLCRIRLRDERLRNWRGC